MSVTEPGPAQPSADPDAVAPWSEPGDENPFPGSRSFTEDDADRFRGRQTESIELVSLLRAQRVVLLYAPSGSGKTSLLQARVLPELEERAGFAVLPVVHVHPGVVPGGAEGAEVVQAVGSVYSAAALLALEPTIDLAAAASLTTWLGDHVGGRVDEYGHPLPTLLVLDQFEQIFEPWDGSDQREGRRELLRQLRQALDDNPSLRLLVAIREEYLARVELLGEQLVDDGFRARYRLGWLTRDDARAAIAGPTTESAVEFSDELVERLLGHLLGDVEGDEVGRAVPAQLQIVCRRIWDEAHRTGRPDHRGVVVAGPELLAGGAGVEQTLEDHYDAGIDGVARSPWQRWRLRRFFDRLITRDGTRQLVARTEGRWDRTLNPVLERLEEVYSLIRSETRAGTSYWELSLDSLVGPVQRANARVRRRQGWTLAAIGALVVAPLVTAFLFDLFTTEERRELATITSVEISGAAGPVDGAAMFDGDESTAVVIPLPDGMDRTVKLAVTFDQEYQIADVAIIAGGDGAGPTTAFLVGQRIEVAVGPQGSTRARRVRAGHLGDPDPAGARPGAGDLGVGSEVHPAMRSSEVFGALLVAVAIGVAGCVVPEGGGEDAAPSPPSLAATDVAVATTLDPGLAALATACQDAGGAACDDLWSLTEAGSELEQLAASCGGRIAVTEDPPPSGDCAARAGGDDGSVPSTTVPTTVTSGTDDGSAATTTTRAATVPTASLTVATLGPQVDLDEVLALDRPPSGGWIAILLSASEADGGQRFAVDRAQLLDRDAEVATGVFDSGDFPSLNDGFWVVYTGPFDSAEAAARRCEELAKIVPDCYPRQLEVGR